ncbi:cytochrome P450 4c21-like isoform X2 [Macrosteles quadrilineatus]|nr:cytochrome P450 4c21-like isoform X2 [Macrosteles quadrilineatus]
MLTLTSLLTMCMVGLLVTWGWLHWKYHKLIRAVSKLEVPFFSFPFLGHSPYTLLGHEGITGRILKGGVEMLERGGPLLTCLWIGPIPLPIIGGVKNIQKILNSSCTSEKAYEMAYIDPFVYHGLLTAPGHIWKIKRRHINPLFHPRNLELMLPTFNRNSEEFVTNLSKHVGSGPFDVMHNVMDTALKTVCNLIFGPDIEFDTESQSFKNLRCIVERILEIFINRLTRFWLRFDVIFEFLYWKEINEMNKLWQEFTEPLLRIAKSKWENKNQVKKQIENDSTNNSTDKSPELLNLLDVHGIMEQKFPEFTETDLKYEMITLYVTGTDSIGGAMSTCLLLLAQYKDIQDRLYQEIAAPDNIEKDVTMEDIKKYTYLDQVYKETLRWANIVPVVARRTTEDLVLDGVTIPAGYTLTAAMIGNHLDPKIFPNPLTFDPERFSSENNAEREPYSFLPFSGGSRNCIGQHYTNMLMKVMLVHILRRYKISTVKDVHKLRRKMVITLISVEGYEIILENREH